VLLAVGSVKFLVVAADVILISAFAGPGEGVAP
jgi:hypothetical protein